MRDHDVDQNFSEHHPQSMHMLGIHGAAYANFAIQESDLIIAVGSRFDDRTTGVPMSRCGDTSGVTTGDGARGTATRLPITVCTAERSSAGASCT